MMKFLRQHSKWILAVFGSGLMIVFLIPQGLGQCANQSGRANAKWATYDGGSTLRFADQEAAAQRLRVVNDIGMLNPGRFPLEVKEPGHWFLLAHEARRQGYVAPRASAIMGQEEAAIVFGNIGQNRVTEAALAEYLGIVNMLGDWQRGALMSDRRLQAISRRLFHEVQVRFVAIEPTVDPNATFSDDVIQTHFETYRDVNPGEGEFGFGYRRPDRFSVETLSVASEDIRAAVESSDDINGIALYKHWRRNGGQEGLPAFDSGADIPNAVREHLVNQLVTEKRSAIEKFISSRLLEAQRGLTSDDDGYYSVPEDWASRRIGFPAIADSIVEEFPDVAPPKYVAVGNTRIGIDELADYDIPINANFDSYGQGATLPVLIAGARELGRDERFTVQEGVAGPALSTPDGTLVFFRITDTDPAHAPATVDEIRDDIIADLSRQQQYESLLAQIDSLEQEARESGLLTLALDRDLDIQPNTTVSRLNPFIFNFVTQQQGQAYPPRPATFPVIGTSETATEAILDRAMSVPQDVAASVLPASQRIFAVGVDEAMTVMIVELRTQKPLDETTYAQLLQNPMLVPVATGEEADASDVSLRDAFSFEALSARHDFELLGDDDDDAAATETADADADSDADNVG